MNRKLAKAIEDYLVWRNKYLNNPSDYVYPERGVNEFDKIIKESNPKDITEMFADLRDYWDTLEVGKYELIW